MEKGEVSGEEIERRVLWEYVGRELMGDGDLLIGRGGEMRLRK